MFVCVIPYLASPPAPSLPPVRCALERPVRRSAEVPRARPRESLLWYGRRCTCWPQLLRRWPAPLSERGGGSERESEGGRGRSRSSALIMHSCSQPASGEGHFRAKRRGKVVVEWPATERRGEAGNERTNEQTCACVRVSNAGQRFQS